MKKKKMNYSLNNFFLKFNLNIGPLFNKNNYLNNFNSIYISKSFSTIYFFNNFQNLKILNNKFFNILSNSIILQNLNFNNLCNNRYSNSFTDISYSSFCNISSTSNGGSIFISLPSSNINLKFCSFINCTSQGGFGGAIFISSTCNSYYHSNICFSNCFASQTHSFRIECSNINCSNFLVIFCSKSLLSSYGSFLLKQKSNIKNFNSTNNQILHHGTGYFLFESNFHQISFGFIDNCIARGILQHDNSGNSLINHLNVFNNTHTQDGIISFYLNSNSNHFVNCIFKKNFISNNRFLYGSCFFSNCTFDISTFNGGTFLISNEFLNLIKTTFITKIYYHEKCLDLFNEIITNNLNKKTNKIFIFNIILLINYI